MSEPLVDPELLADSREALEQMMTDSVTVYVRTRVRDPQGGYSETWAPAATWKARLEAAGQPGMATQSPTAGQTRIRLPWSVKLPWYAIVDEKDRLQTVDGKMLDVISSNRTQTERLTTTVVALEVG